MTTRITTDNITDFRLIAPADLSNLPNLVDTNSYC